MKNMLVTNGICGCAGRLWGTTTAVETIKLLESEGVRENDFYWEFQLIPRNNWNYEEQPEKCNE